MVELSNSLFAFSNLAHLTPYKLEGLNYTVWVSQFEPISVCMILRVLLMALNPVIPNLLLIRTDKSRPLST